LNDIYIFIEVTKILGNSTIESNIDLLDKYES